MIAATNLSFKFFRGDEFGQLGACYKFVVVNGNHFLISYTVAQLVNERKHLSLNLTQP